MDQFLAEVLPRQVEAEKAICNGDPAPRLAMWSRNDPVTVLGIDETRRGKPVFAQDPGTGRWGVVADRWHTGFVDGEGVDAVEASSVYHQGIAHDRIAQALDFLGDQSAVPHWQRSLSVLSDLGAPEADGVRARLAQARVSVRTPA